jgi:hypothetical protein
VTTAVRGGTDGADGADGAVRGGVRGSDDDGDRGTDDDGGTDGASPGCRAGPPDDPWQPLAPSSSVSTAGSIGSIFTAAG